MARESLPRRRENARQKSVFLNLPYDPSFQNLFLAFVVGTTALGLIPRATLEIPGSTRRLDRIQLLIRSCVAIRYTISQKFSWTAIRQRLRVSTCRSSWVSQLLKCPNPEA
jgi:hypothetical protein